MPSRHGVLPPPPYDITDFQHDITGPVTLTIWGYDDGSVPDTGSVILLSGLGIAFVFVLCRKVVA